MVPAEAAHMAPPTAGDNRASAICMGNPLIPGRTQKIIAARGEHSSAGNPALSVLRF